MRRIRQDAAQPSEPIFSGLRNRIETGKAQVRQLELELQQLDNQLEGLEGRLQTTKDDVERYERQARVGIQVNRYRYEQAIDEHNSLVHQYNSLAAVRQLKYAEYERGLSAVNSLVDRYNRGER